MKKHSAIQKNKKHLSFDPCEFIVKSTKRARSAHNRTSPVVKQLVVNIAREYWQCDAQILSDRIRQKVDIDC